MFLLDYFKGLFRPDVKILGEKKNIKKLIKALRHDHWDIRRDSAKILGELKATDAVDSLIAILNDEHRHVRTEAGKALGSINNAKAIEPLVNAQIQWGESSYWSVFAEALEKFGDAAIPYLVSELKSENSHHRKNAEIALDKLKWKPETDAEKINLYVAEQDFVSVAKIGGKGIETLISLLDDQNEDNGVRMEVTKALYKIKAEDDRCVQALIRALKDKNGGVQNHAAIALGEIGDKRGVDPLVNILNTAEDNTGTGGVIKYAAEALGKIGDSNAVTSLMKALSHNNNYVREAAQAALDKLQGNKRWNNMLEFIGNLLPISLEEIKNIERDSVQSYLFNNPSEIIDKIQHEYENNYTRFANTIEEENRLTIILDNSVKIGSDIASPSRELKITIAKCGSQYHVFFKGSFTR